MFNLKNIRAHRKAAMTQQVSLPTMLRDEQAGTDDVNGNEESRKLSSVPVAGRRRGVLALPDHMAMTQSNSQTNRLMNGHSMNDVIIEDDADGDDDDEDEETSHLGGLQIDDSMRQHLLNLAGLNVQSTQDDDNGENIEDEDNYNDEVNDELPPIQRNRRITILDD